MYSIIVVMIFVCFSYVFFLFCTIFVYLFYDVMLFYVILLLFDNVFIYTTFWTSYAVRLLDFLSFSSVTTSYAVRPLGLLKLFVRQDFRSTPSVRTS